jgi:hypothetical protein
MLVATIPKIPTKEKPEEEEFEVNSAAELKALIDQKKI